MSIEAPMNEEPTKRKFFDSFYNTISFVGAGIAVLAFGIILFLILADTLSPKETPYIGILTYIIMPVFLIIGLIIIPIGMWREHSRRAHGLGTAKMIKLDLSDHRHRRSLFLFLGVASVFALFTALGTYRAYEFTDSNTFCGQLCHQVMEPEFTAYQTSAHARVKCVECHVGAGAEWYVKSKLSGAYQVYSVIFHKYDQPIPTPITSLRPARETCEQCHWPAKFYGGKQSERVHYIDDEENTRWKVNLLLKIGGDSRSGYASGIHWHINNKVEYVATDERRQVVPWIRTTAADGTVRVYQAADSPLEPAALDTLQIRTMDCMDCHNRPAHIFESPQISVSRALASGKIDPSLPSIKSTAVEALQSAAETTDVETATINIASAIRTYYEENYPDLVNDRGKDFDQAISETQEIFRRNFFPYMKANWLAYPTNLGHLTAPGCYRCHDGQHQTDSGEIITHDCNRCHLIIEQGDGTTVNQQDLQGLIFKHPVDIDEAWKETGCYECHGQ